MRKWLLTTVNALGVEEVRKVPARSRKEASKKAKENDIVISCVPFEGKAANMYIKICKEGLNK